MCAYCWIYLLIATVVFALLDLWSIKIVIKSSPSTDRNEEDIDWTDWEKYQGSKNKTATILSLVFFLLTLVFFVAFIISVSAH